MRAVQHRPQFIDRRVGLGLQSIEDRARIRLDLLGSPVATLCLGLDATVGLPRRQPSNCARSRYAKACRRLSA